MFRQASYGHGELTVNSTAMLWQWYQNPDLMPKVADTFTITKSSTESGPGVTAEPRFAPGRRVSAQ